MQHLTPEAKAYATAVFARMDRSVLVQILENQLCIQCRDEETKQELAESIVVSVECEDVEFDWSLATANSQSYAVRKLYDEIEEIYEDTEVL